jgi:hypothetical protein
LPRGCDDEDTVGVESVAEVALGFVVGRRGVFVVGAGAVVVIVDKVDGSAVCRGLMNLDTQQ